MIETKRRIQITCELEFVVGLVMFVDLWLSVFERAVVRLTLVFFEFQYFRTLTKRQTPDVLSFKQDKKHAHNQTFQDRLKQ